MGFSGIEEESVENSDKSRLKSFWRRSEAAVKSGRPKPDCSMRLG